MGPEASGWGGRAEVWRNSIREHPAFRTLGSTMESRWTMFAAFFWTARTRFGSWATVVFTAAVVCCELPSGSPDRAFPWKRGGRSTPTELSMTTAVSGSPRTKDYIVTAEGAGIVTTKRMA